MPGVWNINNGYNINTKKVSSKLTFEVGERFTGRIVSKGDGKDVTIKLSDGWQFIAELNGNVDAEDLKLVKFQVDGFENGKLKLKLVQNDTSDSIVDDKFQDIIEKEGLSKDDIEVLKKMVKHNIPLTRENINEIKGLIQFNEKVNSNPKEVDAFIEKYLQSKNIDGNSEQGQVIKDTLTKFFNVFKNLSSDDIITFIENKLDFTEENINSFNKLFKGDSETIEKLLMKISNSLNNLDSIDENIGKKNIDISKQQLINKEDQLNKMNLENNNTTLAHKAYNANDPTNKKLNVLDILKTIAVNNDSEVQQSNLNNTKVSGENISNSIMEKLEDKELVKLLKDVIDDGGKAENSPKNQASGLIEATNKNKLEEILSKVEGKQVKLTDGEFRKLTDLVNNKPQSEEYLKESGIDEKSNIQAKTSNDVKQTSLFKDATGKIFTEELIKNNIDSKEAIKSQVKSRIEDVKDIVRGILNQTELKEAGYEKVMNLIKENINDFKVFNTISDEYYYLNFPIKSENTEYPCKLIIKDNRKDGKKIDTTNTKMVVSVKTINLGEVDGYLTMKDNRIDVNLKCDRDYILTLNNNKAKLTTGLSTLGLFVNVNISEKDKPVDLVNCREFFNDLTISAIDIKV